MPGNNQKWSERVKMYILWCFLGKLCSSILGNMLPGKGVGETSQGGGVVGAIDGVIQDDKVRAKIRVGQHF